MNKSCTGGAQVGKQQKKKTRATMKKIQLTFASSCACMRATATEEDKGNDEGDSAHLLKQLRLHACNSSWRPLLDPALLSSHVSLSFNQ